MKFTFPCIAARIASRAPNGISISDFVAPEKGGTSDHKLLTVPALRSPVSVSASRQETATVRMRIRAIMDVDDFILISRSGQQDSSERDYRTRYQKIGHRFTRKFTDQNLRGFILVAVASDARPQRSCRHNA